MNAIISAVIWTGGTVLLVVLFLAEFFLTIILFPFDKQRRIIHAQCFWWADAVLGMNPYWSLHVTGLENIDHKKTYVVIANHQSIADIIVLYKTHMQFKWIAKESLFKVPLIGWCLSFTRHIKLTRGKFGSIKKIYREAAEWLRKGMSVLFFPEGTRSETSDMKDFQNGAFKLAIKEKKPILPIVISGTREAIPKGTWVLKTKVSGLLKVLPAVDTDTFKPGEYGQLKDKIQKLLNDEVLAWENKKA